MSCVFNSAQSRIRLTTRRGLSRRLSTVKPARGLSYWRAAFTLSVPLSEVLTFLGCFRREGQGDGPFGADLGAADEFKAAFGGDLESDLDLLQLEVAHRPNIGEQVAKLRGQAAKRFRQLRGIERHNTRFPGGQCSCPPYFL